jgi:hypothetical protein
MKRLEDSLVFFFGVVVVVPVARTVLGICYVLNKYSLDEKVWELEVIL